MTRLCGGGGRFLTALFGGFRPGQYHNLIFYLAPWPLILANLKLRPQWRIRGLNGMIPFLSVVGWMAMLQVTDTYEGPKPDEDRPTHDNNGWML